MSNNLFKRATTNKQRQSFRIESNSGSEDEGEGSDRKRRSASSFNLLSGSKKVDSQRRSLSFLNKPGDSQMSKSASYASKDASEPATSSTTTRPSPHSSLPPSLSPSHSSPPLSSSQPATLTTSQSSSSSVAPSTSSSIAHSSLSKSPGLPVGVLLKVTPGSVLSDEAEATLRNFFDVSTTEIILHISPLLFILTELFFRSFSIPLTNVGELLAKKGKKKKDDSYEESDSDDEESDEEMESKEEKDEKNCIAAFHAISRIICIAFSPHAKLSEVFYRFFSSELDLQSFPLLDEKLLKAALYTMTSSDIRAPPAHTLAHTLRHLLHIVSIFRIAVSDSSKKLGAAELANYTSRILSILGSVTVLGIATTEVKSESFFCPLHTVCESSTSLAYKDCLNSSLNLFDCIIKLTNPQTAIIGLTKFFDFTLTPKIGKNGAKEILETVRQFCAYGFPKDVQLSLLPTFIHGILSIFGIISSGSLSMAMPSRIEIDDNLKESLVNTLCVVFELLDGPVPPSTIETLLECLPPMAELATNLADPFTFFGNNNDNNSNNNNNVLGKETLGESAARCVMTLLKLFSPDQLNDLVSSISTSQGRSMLRGLIVVMHVHLSFVSHSSPSLRYHAMTSLLLFLQPLVSHLHLFINPDTDLFNGSGVREAAFWNALFCFVPTFLHYLKSYLRNAQEIDQLATMALSVFEMLMSHAGIGRKQTPFGHDLLKIIPFLPFSILFFCDLSEGTEQKSREIGKAIFFSLITQNVDKLKQFEHGVALTIHTLFSKSQINLSELHLAFEDIEYSYVKMGKETQDKRITDIVMFLRRVKVLAYSWGKIHSDEQKVQYSPSLEELNATVDAYVAIASHFKSYNNLEVAEIYYKREALYLSAVGCHIEAANVLVLVSDSCCIKGDEKWESYIKGAIEQYTKASLWQRAVILYRELKKHNEFVSKDYLRVAQIQLSIAKVYDTLANQPPPILSYYFVVFYGRDFNLLNGSKFVYVDPQTSTTPQQVQRPVPLFASRILDCFTSARPATPSVERLVLSHESMPSSLTMLPGKYIFVLQVYPFSVTTPKSESLLETNWQQNAFSKNEGMRVDDEAVVVCQDSFPGVKLRSSASVVVWSKLKPNT